MKVPPFRSAPAPLTCAPSANTTAPFKTIGLLLALRLPCSVQTAPPAPLVLPQAWVLWKSTLPPSVLRSTTPAPSTCRFSPEPEFFDTSVPSLTTVRLLSNATPDAPPRVNVAPAAILVVPPPVCLPLVQVLSVPVSVIMPAPVMVAPAWLSVVTCRFSPTVSVPELATSRLKETPAPNCQLPLRLIPAPVTDTASAKLPPRPSNSGLLFNASTSPCNANEPAAPMTLVHAVVPWKSTLPPTFLSTPVPSKSRPE